jgi:glucan phosphoethanolaminetransferase (alkaline phosphatase superfamily)
VWAIVKVVQTTASLMQQFLTLHLWTQLLIVAVPLIAVSVFLTYRTVTKVEKKRNDEGTATVVVRFVGAAMVFLGGFAVVTAWQAASAGISDVQREFSSLTAIAQDTRSVTTEESVGLRDKLLAYAREVVTVELADAPTLVASPRATELLFEISQSTLKLAEAGDLSPVFVNSLLSDFDDFKNARNARMAHTGELLPDSLMWGLLLIGFIMVAASSIYPAGPSQTYKWVQSMAVLAVVITILGVVFAIESGDLSREKFLLPARNFLNSNPAG